MITTATIPYGRQTIDGTDVAAVATVLRSDRLTQGPAVERFEAALAEYCGVRHAVAVSHGTAALHLACIALGVTPGRRVVVPALTFVATANAVLLAGGEPLLADVDPRTLNLSPDTALKRAATDPDAVGILPVHFAGLPADIADLGRRARERGLFVLEDACHALGSWYRDEHGRAWPVGCSRHSDATVFSFHPVKHVTCGEGGAVTTNDAGVARRLRQLRSHGISPGSARQRDEHGGWYQEMHELGFNARLTDLQAALGTAQLGRADAWRERRAELAARYDAALADLPGIRRAQQVPAAAGAARHAPAPLAWHLYTVRTARRRELYDHLRAHDVHAQVHYLPVHLHPYYRRRLGTRPGDHPAAEAYHAEALSLPLYPTLTEADQDRVIALIREFHHAS
ncbi:MAG: aminotransferase class I/II-fold pyridoxal phosphate-dependent enzyme [Candidatus Krumholzibacteriia bacterium]